MSVQEICQTPKQAQQEILSSFSGCLDETQRDIKTAIKDASGLPSSIQKEILECLTQESAALSKIDKTTLAKLDKTTAINQFGSALGTLAESSYKLGKVKGFSKAFAKANLAATTGVLYASIRIEVCEGNLMPVKEALDWVASMEKEHAFVKAKDPSYSSSQSNRLYNAIHNFYACGIRNSKDTASKSRDMSKESMAPKQNEKYRNSSYRARG